MSQPQQNGPVDRLKAEAGGLVGALADRAMTKVRDRVESTTGRLTNYVEGDGGPGLMAAVTGARSMAEGKSPGRSMLSAGWAGMKEKVSGMFGGKGKGKSGGKQKLKLTNIVESIEVGVPIRLAYNQWTTFQDFPSFTKKVENADPDENNEEYKVNWKAQIFFSHREWEATITDQRPDERIVWRSKGQKGHVDGAVTFHELGPNLTKIVLVLEYHPQGMFEHTGNLWRAQGRRARLELKHFQRHVMAHALLHPDDVEGWRGTIEDGKVVKDHETALEEEDRERSEEPADTADTDEAKEAEVEEEPADDEELADEEAGEAAPADADADTAGERPSDRRRAPARSGSRGRAPARARQGATRGGTR
jgi:Polyketide cyclase / dehydrase and lipid transport